VKPGDSIPIREIEVRVLSSGGDVIGTPVTGAGQPNPACASKQERAVDNTENARSVGTLVTFGDFRLVNLADLTWNKEFELVCPNNKVGTVDVYMVSHHGMNTSGSPQLVRALLPRAAIMNNGPRKGGTPEAWQTVRDTPGLLDFWQLHFAVAGGKDHNSSDTVIANVDEICEGKWLKLTAKKDGSFTVFNSRNKYEKSYPRK
jgi:hypothetical protein